MDLSKGIEVVDVSTGWRDAGIVGGKNKLVPSVTFRFKNVSEQKLTALQANVVFRHISDDKEWSSFFVKVTGADGLAPGATSDSQRVNAPLGYTGTETRLEMLQNSLRGRQGAGVREIRLDAVDAGRRVPRRSSTSRKVNAAPRE